MAATNDSQNPIALTTTNVVPIIIQREVVAEHVGSHNIVQLRKLDLSRALEEVSVSLDQLHGLDVLGGSNVALINSLHLFIAVSMSSDQGNPTIRKRGSKSNFIEQRPVK